ncbi:helix-turn-helix domain-containing protein [Fructilactobacillus myrtifloralis]|uniref:Helix-turn-helix domain-containing protein n=1 Tax=Fructilactobacillus myrtifloralis TaxID=2940301 RepID=A0ABY5BNB6_9LACO|nr:helix-turn-helix transcriptional regulator [Fructilactobacillus myrtifloralis]USS85170.1 helix-turn-helix domain-containing protein [Fructilactobacillus myrtifloralis]
MSEENKQPNATSVGAQLKSAREQAGISIDELQKRTKIQKRYLTAIENGDFQELPGQFYVRAFVKQYANAVGLNGEQFLQDANLTSAQANPEKDPLQTTTTPADAEQPTENRTSNSGLKETPTQVDKRKLTPIIALVVVVIIVVAVVIFAVAKTKQESSTAAPANSKVTVTNDDAKSKHKSKNQKKSNLKEGQTEIKVVPNSTSDFTVKTGNATSKLELGASQAANATVKVNGNQVWTGTLNQNAGHQVDLPKDTKDVNIHLENAPVSNVKLNGQQVVLPQPAAGQDATKRDMNFKFEE